MAPCCFAGHNAQHPLPLLSETFREIRHASTTVAAAGHDRDNDNENDRKNSDNGRCDEDTGGWSAVNVNINDSNSNNNTGDGSVSGDLESQEREGIEVEEEGTNDDNDDDDDAGDWIGHGQNWQGEGGEDEGGEREDKLIEYLTQRSWTVQQLMNQQMARMRNTTQNAKERNQHGEYTTSTSTTTATQQQQQVTTVVCIAEDEFVFEAVSRMCQYKCGSLCVLSHVGGPMSGVVTERDYLRKVVVHGKNSREIRVGDIMTPRADVISVSPQHTVHECLSIMEEHGFRHLPVLEYDLAQAQAAAALDGLTPDQVPAPKVLAMISQRQLVSQFLKYHHAQVDYMQEYISFPIW